MVSTWIPPLYRFGRQTILLWRFIPLHSFRSPHWSMDTAPSIIILGMISAYGVIVARWVCSRGDPRRMIKIIDVGCGSSESTNTSSVYTFNILYVSIMENIIFPHSKQCINTSKSIVVRLHEKIEGVYLIGYPQALILIEFSVFPVDSVQYLFFMAEWDVLVNWRDSVLFFLSRDIFVLLELETTLTTPTRDKAETIMAEFTFPTQFIMLLVGMFAEAFHIEKGYILITVTSATLDLTDILLFEFFMLLEGMLTEASIWSNYFLTVIALNVLPKNRVWWLWFFPF